MGYLLLADAAQFGAAAGVTQPMLDQASRLIDQYCGRPEGFLIETNQGTPVCMAQLEPALSIQAGPIQAGASVPMAVPAWTVLTTGDVLVLDRGTATAEAVVVQSVAGQVVILQQVQYAHAAGQALAGLCIKEEGPVPAKGIFPLRKSPAIPLAAAVGGQLTQLRRAAAGLVLPDGVGDAEVSYLAGWVSAPGALKQACARVASNIASKPVADDLVSHTVDGVSYRNSEHSPLAFGGYIDNGTAALLKPFIQRV
ncbi:hypothetical protein KIF53_15365 [Chromobacterium subtsugae]|uniref:Uncharacterized protein n=1 Tax=Chromobacterium subtsugae TaxID=251747 RepID=A0ABS7FG03_9NEIS|nr:MULTISPECIES: hypothetical protein [Chromobacterium]KUM02775.1 hypothetical protein Cv017_01620 [Chromobacterium subtsugae]KZE84991.1 hypothetical protein AWB61_03165 [Chromobacterium sp. F49]MBW7567785.1 hypothetical protein [Chromobacterium subtsugae]MBW8289011.1 hypothetical protein [Chromobacterium subtsugae]WSE93844.1 hypothetical protein U6115_11530 [Chromobacterium subtsugae]